MSKKETQKKKILTRLLDRWAFLLPLLSAVMLGVSFINTNLAIGVLVGLVPVLLYAQRTQELPRKDILRSFYGAGVVFFMFCFVCITQTSPNTWTELDGGFATAAKYGTWLLVAAVCAIQFLIIGLLLDTYKSKPKLIVLLLPPVWVLSELVRNYLFAVLAMGPGGSLSPNWNLGNLGTAVAGTPLVYASRFFGLYGLTTIAVIANVAIFLFLQKRYKPALVLLSMIFIVTALGWQAYRPSTNLLSVASIHLGKDVKLGQDRAAPDLSKPADIVVMPEYSGFFDSSYKQYALRNLRARGTIVTTIEGEGSPNTNQLVYYSADNAFISRQDKTFLIAGGEYVPYIFEGLFRSLKRDYIVDGFNQSEQVRKGNSIEYPVETPSAIIGGLACSGVVNLSEYRRMSKEGADILVNPASLSLLNTSSLYHAQERYLTRFHSVANARAFVQASRSGESYIRDSDGEIVSFANGDSGLIESSVARNSDRTIYTLTGENLVLAMLFVWSIYILTRRKVL